MGTENFDEAAVRQTYALLAHALETEIRLIDPRHQKKPQSVFIKTEAEFVQVCRTHNGEYNVYAGINERQEQGTTRTTVKSTKTIVIDIDPVRETDTASNSKELEAARKRAFEVVDFLAGLGVLKDPSIAMSGNGFQIWLAFPEIRVDDTNRDKLEAQIKYFITKLQKKFSDNVCKIDQIGDLPRIIKVIGTLSIKGSPSDERPHRVSAWVTSPVRVEQLKVKEELLALEPPKPAVTAQTELATNPRLSILFEFDEALKGLLSNPSTSVEKYQSRSEFEMAVINKLAFYCFSFEEIDLIMRDLGMAKWRDASQAYRQHTHENAVTYVATMKRRALDEYLSIPIEAVVVYQNRESPLVKIQVREGEIVLDAETVLSAKEFRLRYFFLTQRLLPGEDKKRFWGQLFNVWVRYFGIVVPEREHSTEEQLMIEHVIEEVESFALVSDIKDALVYGFAFVDSESVCIPSKSIEAIIRKSKKNVPLIKLSYWLENYLVKPSEIRRVGKQRPRFWFFKKTVLNMDYETIVNYGEDEKEVKKNDSVESV